MPFWCRRRAAGEWGQGQAELPAHSRAVYRQVMSAYTDKVAFGWRDILLYRTVVRLSARLKKFLRLVQFFLDKLLYWVIIISGSDQHQWCMCESVVDRASWRLARQGFAEVSRETIDGAVLNLLFWQRLILYLGVTIQD